MEEFYTFCRESERKIKIFRDKLILFPVKFLDLLHIRPFYVSLTALTFGLLSVYFLALGKNYSFLLMVLLKSLFDSLDGALVRYKGEEYGQGFWLDYSFDRVVAVFMLVAVFVIQEKTIFYFLTLLSYVLMHLIYIFNHKKLLVLYADTPYYILLAFNKFYASFFNLALNILNLLFFVLHLVILVRRKKHS